MDLFVAGWLQRRKHTVIVADTTWELGSRRLDQMLGVREEPIAVDREPTQRKLVRRALMALLDGPDLHYAVLSSDELELLPATWGMDADRVHFVPFCATRAAESVSDGGGGVFAGGNSKRDYRALADAADSIRAPVRIATNLSAPARTRAQFGALVGEDYERASLAADIVVVPLVHDTVRSAGQQTYLNAMLRGQAVVVTRAPGVGDYVANGRTGMVVDNEPAALADAINCLLEEPEYAHQLGQAGRAEVLRRFQPRHYFDRLLELAGRLQAR